MNTFESISAATYPSDSAASYIPFGYLADFLRFLKRNKDVITLITYDDLAWTESRDPARCYAEEKRAWTQRLQRQPSDQKKIFVLLQHDADSSPERTTSLLRFEESLGIPSTSMIFRRRVNRRVLVESGDLQLTDYPIDFRYLKQLEEKGFVIGYHCNALERALFDEIAALEIMRRDIAELSRDLNLRYMSAHGGVAGPSGLHNRDLPFPADVAAIMRWIHNGRTPWFTNTFSDGGINNLKRDPGKRDLQSFVQTWQRGERYRVLLHPQYYWEEYTEAPRLKGVAWYESVLANYRASPAIDAWAEVRLNLDAVTKPVVIAKPGNLNAPKGALPRSGPRSVPARSRYRLARVLVVLRGKWSRLFKQIAAWRQ